MEDMNSIIRYKLTASFYIINIRKSFYECYIAKRFKLRYSYASDTFILGRVLKVYAGGVSYECPTAKRFRTRFE